MTTMETQSAATREAPHSYTLDQIKEAVEIRPLIDSIAEGFRLYSAGKAVVPPVGYLQFESPPGEVYIKYGYLTGDDLYVMKVASGFSENSALGLPVDNGMMLVFSQETGVAEAILLDEGYLTGVRTGVAGAVAASYLAPSEVEAIGIVGAGTQARLQLKCLKEVTDCRAAIVWGRSREELEAYERDMEHEGFALTLTQDIDDLTGACNLIVTATRAAQPVIERGVRKGAHITAVGADAPGKQELATQIIAEADRVVADSREQCIAQGEIRQAVREGVLDPDSVVELGTVIADRSRGRESDDQLTVADLTGVAVQDVQIAKLVARALSEAGRAA